MCTRGRETWAICTMYHSQIKQHLHIQAYVVGYNLEGFPIGLNLQFIFFDIAVVKYEYVEQNAYIFDFKSCRLPVNAFGAE